jgi:hypothetical protein
MLSHVTSEHGNSREGSDISDTDSEDNSDLDIEGEKSTRKRLRKVSCVAQGYKAYAKMSEFEHGDMFVVVMLHNCHRNTMACNIMLH